MHPTLKRIRIKFFFILVLVYFVIGTSYKIQTLEGEEVVDIPAGISHGELLHLKGKGVPIARGKRGDLVVRVKITLPSKLSRSARTLIEKLREEGI